MGKFTSTTTSSEKRTSRRTSGRTRVSMSHMCSTTPAAGGRGRGRVIREPIKKVGKMRHHDAPSQVQVITRGPAGPGDPGRGRGKRLIIAAAVIISVALHAPRVDGGPGGPGWRTAAGSTWFSRRTIMRDTGRAEDQ